MEMAQQQHINNITAFRRFQQRLNGLSEASCHADAACSILKIDMDGLDQAKTKWPRKQGMDMCKGIAQCWRPQAHMAGAIAWGVPHISFTLGCRVFFLFLALV